MATFYNPHPHPDFGHPQYWVQPQHQVFVPNPTAAIMQPPPQAEPAPENRWDVCAEIPHNAPALISTNNGANPLRKLLAPRPLQVIRSNTEHDIKQMAVELRRQFPVIIRKVKKPTDWVDLYEYFDAVDIWIHDAAFLFYVLHHLGSENEQLDKEYEKEYEKVELAAIEEYVAEWIVGNKDLLLARPIPQDLSVLFAPCGYTDVSELKPNHMKRLRGILERERGRLLAEKREEEARARREMQQAQPIGKPLHILLFNL